MKMIGSMRDAVWRFPFAVSVAVACLVLAAAAVLRAGDGLALTVTNGASACNASTNVLRLWIDVPTHAVRSDVLSHADPGITNRWLLPGMGNAMVTASTWRTTVEIETGFFHARRGGWDCPGYGRGSENGWFQEVGVGVERELGDGISVGLGVSVGRATVR